MINILEIKNFSKEIFSEKYKIYKITSKVNYYDKPIVSNNLVKLVYSTHYMNGGKVAYVLTSSKTTKYDLMNVCGVDRKIVDTFPSDYILLSLLVNSLSNLELYSNNLKGSLYRVIKAGKEVVTIDLKVKENCVLTSNVKTFSPIKANIDKPKYFYYRTGDYMNETTSNSKFKLYWSHSEGKNTVNFYNTDNPDASNRTKTFVLFETVEKINTLYKDFISINFADVNFNTVYSGKRLNDNQTYFSKIMGDEVLNIVFKTDVDEDLLKVLQDNNFNFKLSNGVNKNKCNLIIIKDKEYYEDANISDKYLTSSDWVIQNFVLDGNVDSYIFKLKQCLLEFKIKKEAITRHTEMFDFEGTWKFGKLTTEDKTKHLETLTIRDNTITEEKGIRDDAFDDNTNERFVIIHNNDTIKISSTDIRVLPNFDLFKKDYEKYKKAGIKSFKNKVARDNYYPEIIDIGVFEYQGDKYYTVGPIGAGIQRNIGNFSSVKKIEEKGLRFEEIVDMLKENLVNVNKYSVYPYPFKLMSEVSKNEING